MNRILRSAPAILLIAIASPAASRPGDTVRAIIERGAGGNAAWGVQIVELDTGKVRFEYNQNRLYVPASNTKLFSTALGLVRLGPDYRFHTRVLAASAPDAAGTIPGDLVLVGGGDPNLSGRVIPYLKNAKPGDPLGPIDALAAQIAARGVRNVTGGIAGDDTWYPWEPYPEGWATDDLVWEYGAPVSALTIADNFITVRIRPGAQAGDPVAVSQVPPLDYYTIDNRLRTVAGGETKVWLDRLPGSWLLSLWGTLRPGDAAQEHTIAIADPALFAAIALRDSLERHGVSVRGDASARHAWLNTVQDQEGAPAPPVQPEGIELASRESAPLVEDLRVTDKVSQNLHAELVLRAVARARRNIGTRRAGLVEMDAFLKEAGIEPSEYTLNDGSGLSRMNLVSPAAIVKLLRYMHRSPNRDAWVNLLPVGGEDGTLNTRFRGTAAAGKIFAKTGTVSHVSSLSGYARRANGRMLVFFDPGQQLQRTRFGSAGGH